ncbi:MAG TPA: tetratricopeptide repeat protein [Chthoniobacterales bacterium]|nr:tetratricopeptide repeat protein [Chthoniobacterales bacterium]
MNWRRFLGELQRRNVYRVAVTYTVVSWVLIQITTQVFPFFEIPSWAVRAVILLLVLGFPLALILAWAFELTPEGIKRTEEVPPHESIRHHTGRKLLALAALAAGIALAMFLVQLARRSWTPAKEAPASASVIAKAIPEKSIAVLPFNNLSAEGENVFFTDGIQDEILTDLAKVAELKVISRSSVNVFKAGAPRNVREIGRQLGVAHLLEGSVQRTGGRVRVSAQLIDARTDEHEWAEHYDRELADIFAIQSEIAEAIVRQLQIKLSPTEKAAIELSTQDVGAFDLYLRAKELIQTSYDTPNAKETLLKAVRFLDEAIARDPNFALAYCWLTTAHDNLYWYRLDRTAARLEMAQASAEKALALVPDLGEAHLARALVYYHGKRDYAAALAELALANRTLPNNADVYWLAGVIARRQGRWDDALKNLQRAFELDPRNPRIVNGLSVVYHYLRRYADEEALFERAAVANPATRHYSQIIHAQIELAKGDLPAVHSFLDSLPADYDPDGATTWTRIHLALYERDPDRAAKVLANWKNEELLVGPGFALPVSYWQGLIAHAAGDTAKVGEAFTRARATIEPRLAEQRDEPLLLVSLGLVDAGLGRKEEALREGRRAVELRPLAQDALEGARILTDLALIYAWTGEVDSAIAQLQVLAKTPGGPPLGRLKYDPGWDAVRNDPRFNAMLNELQPR